MTANEGRCEPPPELRLETWLGEFAIAAHKAGWEVQVRLETPDANSPVPVTPPAVVAALVDALEGMLNLDTRQEVINEPAEADTIRAAAASALAAIRALGDADG